MFERGAAYCQGAEGWERPQLNRSQGQVLVFFNSWKSHCFNHTGISELDSIVRNVLVCVTVAILTARIRNIQEHLHKHPKVTQLFSSVTFFCRPLAKLSEILFPLHLINTHRETGYPVHMLMCSIVIESYTVAIIFLLRKLVVLFCKDTLNW